MTLEFPQQGSRLPGDPCPHPSAHPRLTGLKETSPLHGLGHLVMDQSYVCALIAMMVRALARATPRAGASRGLPRDRCCPGALSPEAVGAATC